MKEYNNTILIRYSLLFLVALFGNTFPVFSQQGVAINNTGNSPDPSAILDVSSTDKGIGLPVFTSTERNSIPSPADGLLIYNSDAKELNIHFSGFWFELNSVTDPNTQAGGVGTAGYMLIGNASSPHHSTALDLISNGTHGLALPSANSVSSPAEGLITAPSLFRFYNGSSWKTIETNTLGNSAVGVSADGHVSIGSSNPALGTVLDVQSISQGILPPRMTAAERDAIPSPQEGLFIYNSSQKRMQFWTGTLWKELLSIDDGIFSDDAAADAFGIFSLDSINVSVYRDAWRDKPTNNNSSPCNTTDGAIDLSSATITPPSAEQLGDMTLNAPAGGFLYSWTAPNGTTYTGQNITIPANEVLASLTGNWSLLILNADKCITSSKDIAVVIPLQSQHFNKGVFSGTTNNMEVHRLAWKDHPDSLNTDPCNNDGSAIDLSGVTLTYPSLEQQGSIIMNVSSPISGAVYTWTSQNNSVYVGTSQTIPADSAFASHNGDWSLEVSSNSCAISGKLFDVKIALQTNTHNKGIFSGTTNNTEVHRLAWKDHPDSLNIVPCNASFDASSAFITSPNAEQEGVITLSAPIGAAEYTWYSPNASIYLGNSVTIGSDSAFASHNGTWKLEVAENSCLLGAEDLVVRLSLQENTHSNGVFSGTTNNTEVYRLAWKDHPDSINVIPCTANIDLTLASINSPGIEQAGDLILSAPVGTGVYSWNSPNGSVYTGNPITISTDSVFASHNGEWTLEVVEDYCLSGGKGFNVALSLKTNHFSKGIFSGTTNNTKVHRLAWKDHLDSTNLTPCTSAYVDISSASITPPTAEQAGNLAYNVTFAAGNTYEWTSPNGALFTGNSGIVLANEVIAPFNGEWKLTVLNTASGCIVSGTPLAVALPLKQNTQEKGVFSGSTNNTIIHRNAWKDASSNSNLTP